jgi:hypothetical protein
MVDGFWRRFKMGEASVISVLEGKSKKLRALTKYAFLENQGPY